MTLNRMPILLWEKLTISFMVIFAMPAVMVASGLLLLDRLVGTHFFNPAEGGDVLLYQHLFWFFGHPEVYIIFLPGTAIVSTLVPCFARRRIFGHTAVVVSVVATGFIGFGVWVHHMFATGLPQLSESFFTAASLMIVIPTGVQFFCWLATLWHSRLQLRLPMLWIFGFFFVFLIGGLSGVMLASVPVDTQVHDTYFVVAHFHYVLIGGALFPMFAGIYFWFPKMVGRIADETLGKWHFWLFFIGFNMTFFTMHFLGLHGMTRRVYTYLPDMHWGGLNKLATTGVAFMTAGLLVFLANILRSRRVGQRAGNNPWGDSGLEWSTSSPPPPYNFLHPPTVNGRDALWDALPDQPVVVGLRDDIREVLVTHSLDSNPQHKDEDPGPSIWPFLCSVAVSATFLGSIFTAWAVPAGAPLVIITLIGWLWPRGHSPAPLPQRTSWGL
jgi:cytochrome c oxidase subunit 1